MWIRPLLVVLQELGVGIRLPGAPSQGRLRVEPFSF